MTDASVPRFPEGFERPPGPEDFANHRDEAAKYFKELLGTILLNEEDFRLKLLHDTSKLDKIITALGENHELFPWNNEEIVGCCKTIKDTAFCCGSLPSIPDVLGEGVTLEKLEIRPRFKPILETMLPKLLKTSWKEYPAAMECFTWLLHQSKPNHLSEHIAIVIPPALILVDDFVNENRILGIKCLSRIYKDITLAELKFHGYGQLIYKALEGLLREREASVAECLLPCIFELVGKLETDLGDSDEIQWCRFDDMTEIVLDNMAIEQRLNLRSVYIKFLPVLMHSLEKRIYRWARRLLRILKDYLNVADKLNQADFKVPCVQALKVFVACTPNMKNRARENLLGLLRTYSIGQGIP